MPILTLQPPDFLNFFASKGRHHSRLMRPYDNYRYCTTLYDHDVLIEVKQEKYRQFIYRLFINILMLILLFERETVRYDFFRLNRYGVVSYYCCY